MEIFKESIVIMGSGYLIGILIGFLHELYMKKYGICGKKEIEKYMSNKYGESWLNNLKNKI